MHIAMVLRQFSPHGGLELYAFQLVKGLLERDIRVTVICEGDDSGFAHGKLHVQKFASPPDGASKADKIEHYYKHASDAAAKFGPFDLVHSQHLAISNADVVTFHNHTVFRLSEVGQHWEQTLNDNKLKFSRAYQLRDRYDRELCHRGRCLIFPAKVCLEDFKRHYVLDGKVLAVAHPGAGLASDVTASMGGPVPAEAGAPRDLMPAGKAALPGDPGPALSDGAMRREKTDSFNFLFVGKGYRKKGLDILFAACRLLKARQPNFKLYIAGLRAKPLDKLRLACTGLNEHIEYLGFQKDMDAVYKRAQSIILPSRIEPFGMAPVQGMLRGLVPIVSSVCGVAEVLSDEVDALIVKDHLSAAELSNAMQRLVTDAELTARLSKGAVKTSAALTWDQTVDATIAAYNATSGMPTAAK